MQESFISILSHETGTSPQQVKAVAELLEEGATVPFIARYRKERTGSLDEVKITGLRDRIKELEELENRRQYILHALVEQDVLTDELRKAIEEAQALQVLEDIYLPFRPKRRTRAAMAREKGLEPLAEMIFLQNNMVDPSLEAISYIDIEKGIKTGDDALSGARDIMAERIAEDREIRAALRALFEKEAVLRSEVCIDNQEEAAKYRDYFSSEEPALKAPSHRVLAIFRGTREGFLRVSVRPPEDKALQLLETLVCKGKGACTEQVRLAVNDGYKRLIMPSLENEIRGTMKVFSDEEAILVFTRNLKGLLMAPPLGRKRVLAIDPGFRTGCKVVCLDGQGTLLYHDVIYPTHSPLKVEEAGSLVRKLVEDFQIEAIAIGNGTAGRETESFIRSLNLLVPVIMVNESGASIYSASEVARSEFPNHDITVRGAVSIGRRLQDPLAELVRIDPKAIGVGQYQHDVDQTKLKEKLNDVVRSCVNAVGVELNTASRELLGYVSGIGKTLADNIITHRTEKGPFESREELKKVPRLGSKAFEQAAGFLRISDGSHPLDASAVHPERYRLVESMARDLGSTVSELMRDSGLRARLDLNLYKSSTVGLPTLKDIMAELAKPGRDPREQFEQFCFKEGVNKIEDLSEGMDLPGIVTNVTNFGAFVDIGVHQDGLIHISQLADRFVKDPNEIVKVNQKIQVRVMEIDRKRGRISLTLRK